MANETFAPDRVDGRHSYYDGEIYRAAVLPKFNNPGISHIDYYERFPNGWHRVRTDEVLAIDAPRLAREWTRGRLAVAVDAGELFEGGDWQRQEEQQQAEGPSVAAQIAAYERQLADIDTMIACESGSFRAHCIIARRDVGGRLAALRFAIESRDLDALTAVVAAGNAERRAQVAA